jgi:quercetin dioxygenase-like cupin family protein
MGQVVKGDFWLHVDGQPEQVLRAGESITIPDRAIHNEGATEKPVKADRGLISPPENATVFVMEFIRRVTGVRAS